MVSGDTKRVVVIRDIRSNFIEEAILILKNEPGTKPEKGDKAKSVEIKKKGDDYLLKEAELIINSYIKENKLQITGRAFDRYARDKRKNILINIAINIALLGSIAFLIFLITRIV